MAAKKQKNKKKSGNKDIVAELPTEDKGLIVKTSSHSGGGFVIPGEPIKLPKTPGAMTCSNCRRDFTKFVIKKDPKSKKYTKHCPWCGYEITD